MASSLKTHDVLLDTTVFSEQNHNYRSKAMKALADLAAQDKVGVHITRVVLEEVRAHIRQGVAEAVNLHEHFQDKARILKNSPGVFAAQFKKLDRRALEK